MTKYCFHIYKLEIHFQQLIPFGYVPKTSKLFGVRDEMRARGFRPRDFQHSGNLITETKSTAKEVLLRCVPSASRSDRSKSWFLSLCGGLVSGLVFQIIA